MDEAIDLERLIRAVHALTGVWLSGDQAQALAVQCGTREELLAHGVSQLGWVAENLAASGMLDFIADAAAIGAQQPDPAAVPPPAALSRALPRAEALALIQRFAELPEEADPMDMLRELAVRDNRERHR